MKAEQPIRYFIIAAVLCLCVYVGAALAFDLLVSWDKNTESNLGGYNISYDTPTSSRWETPCGPYEYSSIGLPLVGETHTTTYTISDATVGNYAFYVRAYNTNGLMSDYEAYAGTVSLDGEEYTWTTLGISEPTNCVPDALISVSHSTGITPQTISFDASTSTNDPDTWYWWINWVAGEIEADADYTTESFDAQVAQRGWARLRVYNDTWFDDAFTWLYIQDVILRNIRVEGGVIIK